MSRAQAGRDWDELSAVVAREAAWNDIASEVVRYLRGARSKRELAELLDLRERVLTDWEAGRRFPTAQQTLSICERLGVDVRWVLSAFAPAQASWLGTEELSRLVLAGWLDALRGDRSVSALARASGISRYALMRWLHGAAQPRLPQFMLLVHVLTGRLDELMCELLRSNAGPELWRLKRQRRAAWRRPP